MDLRQELEQERARRAKLEQELATWQNTAISKVRPEELAAVLQTQQLEALTFHLLKQKQAVDDVTKKLQAKEKELTLAVENIKSLEGEVEGKDREIERLKKQHVPEPPAEKPPEKPSAGGRFGQAPLPSDDELDSLLNSMSTPPLTPDIAASRSKKPKTFKDFIQIIRRMERIKLFDATMLLDVGQDEVMLWARALERKGYVTIHGLRDKTIIATERMLKTR